MDRDFNMYLQPAIRHVRERPVSSPLKHHAALDREFRALASPLPCNPNRCKSAPVGRRKLQKAQELAALTASSSSPFLLPEGRSRASAIVYASKLYIFGGLGNINTFTGDQYRNDTMCYSLQTNEWSRLPCSGYFPKARIHHSAVLRDHKMVIFGGVNEDLLFLNDMFALSLRDSPCVWKKVAVDVSVSSTSNSAPATTAPFLCSHSAVIHPHRNSMVVYGGKTIGGAISQYVYEFSFALQQWTCLTGNSTTASFQRNSVTQEPEDTWWVEGPALYCHTAAVCNGVMYVAGGYTHHPGQPPVRNLHIFAFDFGTTAWRVAYRPRSEELPGSIWSPLCTILDAEQHCVWALGDLASNLPLSTAAYLPLDLETQEATDWVSVHPWPRKSWFTKKDLHLGTFLTTVVGERHAFLFGGEKSLSPHGNKDDKTDSGSPLKVSTFYSDLYSFDLDRCMWVRCDSKAVAWQPCQEPTFPQGTEKCKRRKQKVAKAPKSPQKSELPSHIPLWQRDFRPQLPTQPPDLAMHYGQKPTEQTKAKPLPTNSPDHRGGVQKSTKSMACRSPVQQVKGLTEVLADVSPVAVLHCLLTEKYRLEKEKRSMLAAAAASQDEVHMYEHLLDQVIEDHIAKVSAAVGPPQPSPSLPKAKRISFVDRQRQLTRTTAKAKVAKVPEQSAPAPAPSPLLSVPSWKQFSFLSGQLLDPLHSQQSSSRTAPSNVAEENTSQTHDAFDNLAEGTKNVGNDDGGGSSTDDDKPSSRRSASSLLTGAVKMSHNSELDDGRVNHSELSSFQAMHFQLVGDVETEGDAQDSEHRQDPGDTEQGQGLPSDEEQSVSDLLPDYAGNDQQSQSLAAEQSARHADEGMAEVDNDEPELSKNEESTDETADVQQNEQHIATMLEEQPINKKLPSDLTDPQIHEDTADEENQIVIDETAQVQRQLADGAGPDNEDPPVAGREQGCDESAIALPSASAAEDGLPMEDGHAPTCETGDDGLQVETNNQDGNGDVGDHHSFAPGCEVGDFDHPECEEAALEMSATFFNGPFRGVTELISVRALLGIPFQQTCDSSIFSDSMETNLNELRNLHREGSPQQAIPLPPIFEELGHTDATAFCVQRASHEMANDALEGNGEEQYAADVECVQQVEGLDDTMGTNEVKQRHPALNEGDHLADTTTGVAHDMASDTLEVNGDEGHAIHAEMIQKVEALDGMLEAVETSRRQSSAALGHAGLLADAATGEEAVVPDVDHSTETPTPPKTVVLDGEDEPNHNESLLGDVIHVNPAPAAIQPSDGQLTGGGVDLPVTNDASAGIEGCLQDTEVQEVSEDAIGNATAGEMITVTSMTSLLADGVVSHGATEQRAESAGIGVQQLQLGEADGRATDVQRVEQTEAITEPSPLASLNGHDALTPQLPESTRKMKGDNRASSLGDSNTVSSHRRVRRSSR